MEVLASLLAVLGVLAVAIVIPSVICWLKGKRRWAILGFWTGWHWVPVIRLAKPTSWWARKYYGPDKLARSMERFPNEPRPALTQEVATEITALRERTVGSEYGSNECAACGAYNAAGAETCRKCRASLSVVTTRTA
jgi:hypothetical protein